MPRAREGFAGHFLNREKLAGRKERGGEKEDPGSSGHDQEAAQIEIGRRGQNPQGRGENGYDQSDDDRRQRPAHKRHGDRYDIENENANPDGRRCFAFRDAKANEHERQQRHVTLPRPFR